MSDLRPTHTFGGAWTDKKLSALARYLAAYQTIFTRNDRARYLKTIYVDAFAGTGSRSDTSSSDNQILLWENEDTNSVENYKKGSARIALGLIDPFDRYIFIDNKAVHVQELTRMITDEFPSLQSRCEIRRADANEFLCEFCRSELDKVHERAVVFLDPYGMNVEWRTISTIANTKVIDLWILFPVGTGVNRLLTRGKLPPDAWQQRLTKTLGTEDWLGAFYRQDDDQMSFLEDDHPTLIKDASFESIGKFFLDRLKEVFAGVAPQPLVLLNSKGNPLYWLFFAVSNKRAVGPALRIANWITETS